MSEGQTDLVLDTSVWINLLATGCWQEIVAALRCLCIAPEPVANEIKRDPVTSRPYERPGDPLYGVIPVEQLDEAELATFFALVSAPLGDRLGDGEAAAIAVATHRSLTLVIDERKARRIISAHWPTLPLLRSSELLRLPSVVDALGIARADDAYMRACEIARMHV